MAGRDDKRVAPVSESLKEYGRGLVGGLLFSLPLLYTMEVWWSGFIATHHRLLILLALTFVLLLGFNRYAGLREDATWGEVAIDSIEELGLGVSTAAGVLYLIGRIDAHTAFSEALGKIVVEAAIVAIGFSVGTAQLGGGDGEGGEDSGKRGDERRNPKGVGGLLVIPLCGAVLFASNVGPTEEIVIIALESGPLKLVGLTLLSIALSVLVLYHVDFKGSGRIRAHARFEKLLRGIVAFAVGLVASAVILWFFGRFDGASLEVIVRETVALSFPATLGASAGSLLLQP